MAMIVSRHIPVTSDGFIDVVDLETKANLKDVYTKEQIDKFIASGSIGGGGAGGLDTYYSKDEIDEKLNKDIMGNVYSKIEVNSLLQGKVDNTSLKDYVTKADLKKDLLLKVDKTDVDTLIQTNNERFQQLTEDIEETETKIATNYNTLVKSVTAVKDELVGKISDLTQTVTDNRNESLNKDKEHDSLIDKFEKMISAAASETNKLVDKAYVDDAIKNSSANGITADADGNGFASLDALKAGPWYSLGVVTTTPTKNDYAIVKSDVNHNGNDVRYNYDGKNWIFFQEFKSGSGDLDLTTAQQLAINSGVTTEKVTQITTNQTAIKLEAETRETNDNTLTQRIAKEETARLNGDTELLTKIGAIEAAYVTADDAIKKLINDNKLDIEARVGSLTTLNTDVKTSIVDAMNDLHNELHDERVAKAGDTMTGCLKIQVNGSEDMFHLSSGDTYGVVMNLDSTTGHLNVIPDSARTTGFVFSAINVSPRTADYPYSLGTATTKWDTIYVNKINTTNVSDLATNEQINALKTEVANLKAELASIPRFGKKEDGSFVFTQVEYDNLTDEEKNNGKMYIIVN